MISIIQRKTTLSLISVVMIVFMYDIVFDLLDKFLSFIHVLYEWVEFILHEMISGLFETSHSETELITFYLMLSIGFYVLYRFFRVLPRIYRQFKRNQKAAWLRQKRRMAYYWRHLSLFNKIKLFSLTSTGTTTCLLFLI
jgi:hypothetical protein